MELIDVLQAISQDGYKGMKPTDLCFGTVASLEPFSVTIEGTMQALPAEALIRTVGVMRKEYTGRDSDGDSFTVVINEGLEVGNRVLMLRCASGQRFIVLSKAY